MIFDPLNALRAQARAFGSPNCLAAPPGPADRWPPQKENRFTTCLLGRPVMVSPPDVFDTESARGHPRPVLYHLWTKVAARSCLIEEAPEPTAASARVPRPLTGLSPGWRRCRYYPLLDEVICPTVAPRLSWSSRTRAVDRTEYRYTPARELSRGQHTGLQRAGPAGVWELVLQLDPAMVEAPCAGRAVGALILSCIPTEPLPPSVNRDPESSCPLF